MLLFFPLFFFSLFFLIKRKEDPIGGRFRERDL